MMEIFVFRQIEHREWFLIIVKLFTRESENFEINIYPAQREEQRLTCAITSMESVPMEGVTSSGTSPPTHHTSSERTQPCAESTRYTQRRART